MPTLQKEIRLHQTQAAFRRSDDPIRGFVGGIGSGKSWVGAYDLIRRAKPKRLYLVTAPTYPMLQDASLRTFVKIAQDLHFLAGLNRSDLVATLGNGAEILFRSADNPDRLRGPNASGAWMDEASLQSREAFDIVLGRLREEGEQGWLSATFTPRGRRHWTYDVFGQPRDGVALFHARTRDNPFLPPTFVDMVRSQYTTALAAQELEGLFTDLEGSMFHRQWFPVVDQAPASIRKVRAWDLAGTEAKKGTDPDYTAGPLLGRCPQAICWVLDVRRTRATAAGVESLVKQTATLDGPGVPTWMEQEPGQSGKGQVDHYRRNVLAGCDFHAQPSSGDKALRARPLAAAAEAGNVRLVRAPWNKDWLDEFETFPGGDHDDQVDATSLAYSKLFAGPWEVKVHVNPHDTTLVGQMPEGVFLP